MRSNISDEVRAALHVECLRCWRRNPTASLAFEAMAQCVFTQLATNIDEIRDELRPRLSHDDDQAVDCVLCSTVVATVPSSDLSTGSPWPITYLDTIAQGLRNRVRELPNRISHLHAVWEWSERQHRGALILYYLKHKE